MVIILKFCIEKKWLHCTIGTNSVIAQLYIKSKKTNKYTDSVRKRWDLWLPEAEGSRMKAVKGLFNSTKYVRKESPQILHKNFEGTEEKLYDHFNRWKK